MTPDMLICVSFNLNDEILGDFFFLVRGQNL